MNQNQRKIKLQKGEVLPSEKNKFDIGNVVNVSTDQGVKKGIVIGISVVSYIEESNLLDEFDKPVLKEQLTYAYNIKFYEKYIREKDQKGNVVFNSFKEKFVYAEDQRNLAEERYNDYVQKIIKKRTKTS